MTATTNTMTATTAMTSITTVTVPANGSAVRPRPIAQEARRAATVRRSLGLTWYDFGVVALVISTAAASFVSIFAH